jgi:hypothetical protein
MSEIVLGRGPAVPERLRNNGLDDVVFSERDNFPLKYLK